MKNNTLIRKYNFQEVEKKWKDSWYKENLYRADDIGSRKPKFYALDTWPYPSAEGVHLGYIKSFGGTDLVARYKRMKGYNVLYPTGWDTLGLPAENYAIKSGRHPREITLESIKNFKEEFKSFALSIDWSRELDTADPTYYKWTQWIFLLMYKNRLAYKKKLDVNWCPKCMTVLAKEQVMEDGTCERCSSLVTTKNLDQWYFKITDYADRLYEDSDQLDWNQKYKNIHKKWIGKKVKNGKITFHVKDWCVSRQRYWGPPIPIIYCKSCGTVPVPEKDLPVILPLEVDFTPTGKSPLAKDASFVNISCPTCGGDAKRETDTLDTFVSSSWYEYRFMDTESDTQLVSLKDVEYWKNVDHYQGSIEHLTAHLVYARFVTKVLFDNKFILEDEPFPKYVPVGLLVDKNGTKFSKRLGNAPSTSIMLGRYGGDILRMSCQFTSPFGDITKWNEGDLVGVQKFRDRIWTIFNQKIDGKKHTVSELLLKELNILISEVESNIEQMKFNVALSKMMVFSKSLLSNTNFIDILIWETYIKLLAPFIPFLTEEIWNILGHTSSIHKEEWPKCDSKYLNITIVNIQVQVNGKKRLMLNVDQDLDVDHITIKALENESIKERVGKTFQIKFVKNRVINFIVN